MFDIKNYSDIFTIKKERDDYTIKEYIGNIDGTLIIPEGITRISQFAFSGSRCSKIKKIVFPKTLKRIPDSNFSFWKNLEEVVISEGVISIGKEAFMGTGIREVILPSTINKIEKDVFAYCDKLEKITLLHLSTSILNSLMNGSYVNGWSKTPQLKYSLFFGLSEDICLTDYFRYYDLDNGTGKFSIEDSFVIYDKYVVGYIGNETEVKIPESVNGIAYEAFFENKKIRSITLSKKIKTIGYSAFEGCSLLREVILNKGLEQIGDYAFADTGIESIRIPQEVKYVGERVFENCNRLKEIDVLQKLIGDYHRTYKWHSYWDSGCNAIRKTEYIDE